MSTLQQIDRAADVHARRTVRNVHLLVCRPFIKAAELIVRAADALPSPDTAQAAMYVVAAAALIVVGATL